MKAKNSLFFTKTVILTAVFLLAVNFALGSILMNQSGNALRTQLRERMLDVSSSAAALLDGDALERLTAADAGTEDYRKAMDTLRAFQDNAELSYIYGIRDMGDGTFTFTVDPTVADPGAFGESIQYTEALHTASLGTPAVDETSYVDRWGRFYSAYSPVFDSAGRVAGIVAVDYDAAWYEKQIAAQRTTVFIIGVVSLLIGATIVAVATEQLRKRFVALNMEVRRLAEDASELSEEIGLVSGKITGDAKKTRRKFYDSGSDSSIDALNAMVRGMHEELRGRISDVHALASTDVLTGVGNRSAYFEEVDRLNQQIVSGKASFAVAVFDVNVYRTIDDRGDRGDRASGDRLLVDAASALKSVFRSGRVYRIGGDEFVAILDNATEEKMNGLLAELRGSIAKLNAGRETPLTVSGGAAEYLRGTDGDYDKVFRRAGKAMNENRAD